jgi:hypothetical protein
MERQRRRTSAQHRRTPGTGRPGRPFTVNLHLTGLVGKVRPPRWMGQTVVAVGMLAVITGLSVTTPTPAALAAAYTATHHAQMTQVSPPAHPASARWSDPKHGTSYVVWLTPDALFGAGASFVVHPYGAFTFTLADGSFLQGIVPITGPDNNNLDTQDTVTLGRQTKNNTCLPGTLTLASTPSPGSVPTATVVYTLRAHFDNDGLVAFAHLSYALVNSVADETYIGALCSNGVDSPHVADMSAGCPDLISPCASPLDTAMPAVSSFDSKFIQAVSTGNWDAVYNASTEAIQGQYTAQEFSAAINAQLNTVGRITAITPISVPPQIQTGTVGEPFFSVVQTATISLSGKTFSRAITSYFLLEQGQWRFWFSV